jgi:hypothetical protein
MTDAEIAALTDQVEGLIAKIDREIGKARHTVTVTHDDGDPDAEYEDVSNPSLSPDDSGNPGDDDFDDGLDDDEDEQGLTKAEVTAGYQNQNSAANRPGGLKTSTHTQPRHKFESLVDKIKNEQGIPKSQAMAYARQQYPDVYQSYQEHSNGNGNGSTFKRAPAAYEQMVEIEMAKGVNREIAGQRVAQQHGFRAFDQPSRITKRRDDLLFEFNKRTAEIMCQDGVDAIEATRRVRKEDPRLFSALQRAG